MNLHGGYVNSYMEEMNKPLKMQKRKGKGKGVRRTQ